MRAFRIICDSSSGVYEDEDVSGGVWVTRPDLLVARGVCVDDGWKVGVGRKELKRCVMGVVECLRESHVPVVVGRGEDFKVLLEFGGGEGGVVEVFDLGVCGEVEAGDNGYGNRRIEERAVRNDGAVEDGLAIGIDGGDGRNEWGTERNVDVGVAPDVNVGGGGGDDSVGSVGSGAPAVVESIEGLLQENGETPGSSIRGAMLYSSRENRRSLMNLSGGVSSPTNQLQGTAREAWTFGATFAALVDIQGWDELRRSHVNRVSLDEPEGSKVVAISPGVNPWYSITGVILDRVVGEYYMNDDEMRRRKDVALWMGDLVNGLLEWETFVVGASTIGGSRKAMVEIVACAGSQDGKFTSGKWAKDVVTKLCEFVIGDGGNRRLPLTRLSYDVNTQAITCRCGQINVKITANTVQRLSMNVMCARASLLLGRRKLFEEGLSLIESWANSFVNDKAGHQLLSRDMMEVMLLYLTNAFHAGLMRPLEVLACFLTFYSSLDLSKYGLTLAGPVRLRNVKIVSPLTPIELLLSQEDFPVELPSEENFDRTAAIYIWSPTPGCENVGKHVTVEERSLLMKALNDGCRLMKCIEREMVNDVEGGVRRLLGPSGGADSIETSPHTNSQSPRSDMGSPHNEFHRLHLSSLANVSGDEIRTYMVWEATARLIVCAEVSELGLLSFLVSVVEKKKSLLIGEIGQALRNTHGTIEWGILLKERFGGLKKFLRNAVGVFVVGTDHPLNPRVRVCDNARGMLRKMAI